MPTPVETVEDFMAALIEAWPTADTAALGRALPRRRPVSHGSLEPVRGRAAIEATFAQFMRVGGLVDVEMIHMMAEGSIVMTERVDHLTRADG